MMKQLVVKMVEEGLAKDSIRLYLTSLGVLYNQAIDDKVVSENPTKALGKFFRQAKRKHEEISPLTEEEPFSSLRKPWSMRGSTTLYFSVHFIQA